MGYIFPFIIFVAKAGNDSAKNGYLNVHISYNKTPKDQTSLLYEYG